MSPSVINKEQKEKNIKSSRYIKKIRQDLLKMRNFIEKNFKYVGDNLPQEVRNIYYDKSKGRLYQYNGGDANDINSYTDVTEQYR